MKKIAMVFAFVLVSFCGYAQNIKFNGVPLGIELGQFDTLLKEKGYEVLESEFNSIDAWNMSYYVGVFFKFAAFFPVYPITQKNIHLWS